MSNFNRREWLKSNFGMCGINDEVIDNYRLPGNTWGLFIFLSRKLMKEWAQLVKKYLLQFRQSDSVWQSAVSELKKKIDSPIADEIYKEIINKNIHIKEEMRDKLINLPTGLLIKIKEKIKSIETFTSLLKLLNLFGIPHVTNINFQKKQKKIHEVKNSYYKVLAELNEDDEMFVTEYGTNKKPMIQIQDELIPILKGYPKLK